ncbi:TNFAIP3-interacting protein 3 [Vulpes lagopus]
MVAELKTKLDAAERFLSTQEKEREQSQRDSDRLRDQTRQRLQRQEKEKESLNEELHELKKENKLLKEKNALVSKKKEHYECEIKRLNKALQDALKIESSSFPEDYLGKYEMECRHEEMRTEMEVLKQQVQIYEEDFKKERSDRERLNQEKEELQQINQTSQSQLNRLNSQIKACQMEKEKLEKQLKQVYFPICSCSLNFHPCAPAGPGTAQDPQKHPISKTHLLKKECHNPKVGEILANTEWMVGECWEMGIVMKEPDYQWYAPDQFPPDVQHKANGFSSEKKVKQ